MSTRPTSCERCGTEAPHWVATLELIDGLWTCYPCEEQIPEASENGGLRTRGVIWERVRPIRWLWQRRIPLGLPSLIVGEEDVGKGTVSAWLIARATRGELDGDQRGKPINVLIIGDEDGFESVWVPRIHAAGGDLGRIRTLDDGEYLDDLTARGDDLAVTVERDQIGLIILDQVLDHVDGGKDGSGVYNPKNVRQAMLPLRRVAGAQGVAAIGLLHPIQGKPRSFRELIAGSHQFNAVSRSSLLLGKAPEDKQRRVLVRGKGNHSAAPRSFEFEIGITSFDLKSGGFEGLAPVRVLVAVDDLAIAQLEVLIDAEIDLHPLILPRPVRCRPRRYLRRLSSPRHSPDGPPSSPASSSGHGWRGDTPVV